VLEVELAARSGLGWRGKHTLALQRDSGSMFFLGEIFVDLDWQRGEKAKVYPQEEFGALGGSGRFLEIWNLVFMQYEQLAGGHRIDLPRPSIDTGMGLERIAAVLQGTHDNYKIDLFGAIISHVADLTGVEPAGLVVASQRQGRHAEGADDAQAWRRWQGRRGRRAR